MIEFITAYRKSLAAAKETWIESTGSGGAATWDDYKRRVGVIVGLNDALKLFDETVKAYFDESTID